MNQKPTNESGSYPTKTPYDFLNENYQRALEIINIRNAELETLRKRVMVLDELVQIVSTELNEQRAIVREQKQELATTNRANAELLEALAVFGKYHEKEAARKALEQCQGGNQKLSEEVEPLSNENAELRKILRASFGTVDAASKAHSQTVKELL